VAPKLIVKTERTVTLANRQDSGTTTMTKRARRPGKDSRRRPQGTPSVIFLDDCRWNAFHQLAPLLRRAGVRTIRVSTESRVKTRVASRLLFDRYAILPDESDVGAFREILAGEDVVDIQFAESLGDLVAKSADLLQPDVAEQVGRRISVVDKFVAAGMLAAAGVRTPEVVPVADATPAEMAERFGFPIVVKERVGYGGERVSIVGDLEALVAATSGWGRGTGDLFYEQYVDGTKLNYAAVVSSTGIEQELAYQVTRWRQPVGRASEVETIDDAQLVAFGRRALDVVGCKGLVNMDVIRDVNGVDWLIDFNARAFGGSGNFLAAGIDTSEGYLRAIGLRAAAPKRTKPVVGIRIRVFPTSLEDVIDSGSIPRTVLAFARDSSPYIRWLGVRYWLSEAFLTADSLRLSRKEARAASAPRSLDPIPKAGTMSSTPTR